MDQNMRPDYTDKEKAAYALGVFAAESGCCYYSNPFYRLFVQPTVEEIAWSLGYNSWYCDKGLTYHTAYKPHVAPVLRRWEDVLAECRS